VVNRMLQDVVKATRPLWAELIGDFTPRGGISTRIKASYSGKNIRGR